MDTLGLFINSEQKSEVGLRAIHDLFCLFLAVSSLAPGTRIGLSAGFHQVPL